MQAGRVTTTLDRARDSFRRRAWAAARTGFEGADLESPLGCDDLGKLARAAYLDGNNRACVDAWARAHRVALDAGDGELAARCAFWSAFVFMNAGDMAQAGAWLGRAEKLVEALGAESVAAGLVLLPQAVQWLHSGEFGQAEPRFADAARVGDRTGDADLQTLAALGQGQALVGTGRITDGLRRLDEAMLAVTADEVNPVVAGLVYCAVIETCHEVFDIERAQEWTGALVQWCDSQTGLVPYRGQCMIHRAQLMQLRGEWSDSLDESTRALQRLSDPPGQHAAGEAHYQLAELHRVTGRFDQAEEHYRLASEWGRQPQPGLALLRLAQGRVEVALSSVRRLLDERSMTLTRFEPLAAMVDIALEAGAVAEARAAADALAAASAGLDKPFVKPYLVALCAAAEGAVLLREGRPREAVDSLRTAWSAWRDLEAPYEAARVRVLLGLACQEQGDLDGAELEFEAARTAFTALGATPELERLSRIAGAASSPGGLTTREVEVLRLVASGATNRSIADELVISEKTVARHVSNIFLKLDLSSRAAATAYAYEHGLVVST